MLLQQLLGKSQNLVLGIDFDGTLINSSQRHFNVLHEVLEISNLKLDISDLLLEKAKGLSTVNYLISKGVDQELATKIAKLWIDRIELEQHLDKDVLFHGSRRFLEEVSKSNQLILVTARKNVEGLYSQLIKFDIKNFFSGIYIVSPSNAGQEKIKLAQHHKFDCMIGDTEVDLNSALHNNIPFIHIRSPFRSEKFLRNISNTFVSFNHIYELI